MSVHQTDDGRWFVKHAKGKNPEKPNGTRTYFGRGEENRQHAVEFNLELGLGQNTKEFGSSFAELATVYMQAKRSSMTLSTLKDAGWKLDGTILPYIGERSGSSITPELLDQYVLDRKAAGLKVTSIHRELSIIRAIIRWAVHRQLLTHNPMERYTFPTRDDSVIPPPTEAELAAIYEVAAPHLQRAMTLGYFTGMRPGASELLSLRWEHIDLVNKTIYIESAKKGGMKSRVVTIANGLYDAAQEWLVEDRERGPLGWVVHYHGKKVERIKTAWDAAKRRAGITRRIRLYDIRHMAATSMLAAGADTKSVSEILGHASVETTLKVYQHVNTALRAQAVSKLGNWLPELPRKD